MSLASFHGWLDALELHGKSSTTARDFLSKIRLLLETAGDFKPGDSDLEDEYSSFAGFFQEMQRGVHAEELGEEFERNCLQLVNAIIAYIQDIVLPVDKRIHIRKGNVDPITETPYNQFEKVYVIPAAYGAPQKQMFKRSTIRRLNPNSPNYYANPFTRYVPTTPEERAEVVSSRVHYTGGGRRRRRTIRKLNKRNGPQSSGSRPRSRSRSRSSR